MLNVYVKREIVVYDQHGIKYLKTVKNHLDLLLLGFDWVDRVE